MQDTYQNQARQKLIAAIVVLAVFMGTVVFIDHFKDSDDKVAANPTSIPATSQTTTTSQATTPSTSTPTPTASTPSTNTPTTTTSSGYKDGTYKAASSYYVPHGNESIQVSLTIKDGTVTGSQITNSMGDPESASFQERFAATYINYVVGQKIADLQLSVIAGASDTTDGFNQAVQQIASQAKA